MPHLYLNKRIVLAINFRLALFIVQKLVQLIFSLVFFLLFRIVDNSVYVFLSSLLVLMSVIMWVSYFCSKCPRVGSAKRM